MHLRTVLAATLIASTVSLTGVAAHANEVGTPATPDVPSPEASESADSDAAPDITDTAAPEVPTATEISVVIDTAINYATTVHLTEELQRKAVDKRADATAVKTAADKTVNSVTEYLISPQADSFIGRIEVVKSATTPDDVVEGLIAQEQVNQVQAERLTQAQRAYDRAVRFIKAADAAEKSAEDSAARAATLLDRMNTQAKEIGLGSSEAPTGLPSTPEEQKTWNDAVKKRWTGYSKTLSENKVAAPTAKKLREKPQKAKAGDKNPAAPGTEKKSVGGDEMTVFPQETTKFLSTVIDRIGDPYSAAPAPGRWTCSTLLSDTGKGSYSLSGSPAEIYSKTKSVKASTKQPGDLIFLSNKSSGIHHVGVYVGSGQMIDAPGTRYTTGVSEVPDDVFAVTRPALGAGNNEPPAAAANTPDTVCNAGVPAKVDGWKLPMERGGYVLTSRFGAGGSMWANRHTGQDFAAPLGTPIYASRAGTVSIEAIGWAGNLITVTRPDGSAERYAHTSQQLVSEGDTVKAGQEIALVGSEGNSTGPHLHFEIIKDGEMVDPIPLLVKYLPTEGGPDAWGGYGNGRLPIPVLCPISDGMMLRCDAAADFTNVQTEFKKKFGSELPLIGAYQPIVDQIVIGVDGNLKDLPGTSPYGWGVRTKIGPIDDSKRAWLNTKAETRGWKSTGNEQFTYTAR